MSKDFPKNKKKRPRTSSNETNMSFVKNVTSRVSGLLPSTITKWFSSPSSSNANGSTATAEATDSSTEDEAPEDPVITQPPSKRLRYNTPGKYNHFGPSDGNCLTSHHENTEIPVNPFSGVQFHGTSQNNITLTPIRTRNETITNDTLKDKSEREASRYKLQHTLSGISQSVASKRKSIFDRTSEDTTKASTKTSPNSAKKPCFKPSLLGSPFYPGRTMYGGSASSYVNQPNIQQQTVALVNETNSSEDSVMSSSARRIMDLLEAYSSPLREASRIPQYTRPKSDSFNISTERFTPYSNKNTFYKTQELYVPSIASILRLKQRSRLMDTTKTARQIIASHSSATNYPLTYPPTPSTVDTSPSSQPSQPVIERQDSELQNIQNNKMTTKVKARVTRTNRGSQDPPDMVTPLKLPSATLQIDQNKLPNFSFDTSANLKLSTTSTAKISIPAPKSIEIKKNIEIKENIEITTSKQETVISSSAFKFSNPVRISSETPDVNITPPKFKFDSPERQIDQKFNSNSDVSSVVGNVNETDKYPTAIVTTKPKDWQCPECWVNNKAEASECVCCRYKHVKPTKCSVCKIADCQAQKDKCALCVKMASPPSAKTSPSSKWKCGSCWIMNEDSAEKCVCCSQEKPNEATKAKALAADFKAKPKVKPYPCGGCFTVYGSERAPTPPMLAQLPAITTNFFGSSDKVDSGFITLAKTQKSDKWECSSCLVRNESDKSACVCCGAEKEPKSKLPDSKFNFGTNANTSFKFGIDPKVQEAKIRTDMIITPEPLIKEKSEANNNVLAATPTYTFTLPTKKIETKPDAVLAIPETAVTFSFGVPRGENAPLKKTETTKVSDEERPQEVPQVNFASPIQETAKPLGGLFSSSLTQQAEKEKPSMITSNLFTLPTTEAQKDTISNAMTLQPATSAEKPQTQTTFLKIATNLFAAPTTISSPANPFSQNTTVTTSGSNIPLMLPVASVQKTETTSTLAPVQAAPMFSFGTNSASNSVQPAAPTISSVAPAETFQFTFGSNNSTKTEPAPSLLTVSNAQAAFKSPFGSTGDSVTNNTFNLTPGNAFGSSALATNTNGPSATNGLPGNGIGTLGSNTLSGNPLGGNTMTGNNLSGNILGVNTFGANNLTGGNSVTSANALGGSNGLPGNTGGSVLHSNNTSNPLSNNPLTSGNSNIFGNTVQKENMWNTASAPPSTNMFVSNATTNNLQNPPTFQFGATSPPPAFGSNAQPAQNIFGLANQTNNSQPSLFSNPAQNQSPAASLFGSPQPPSNPPPQMGMFGTTNMNATPTFGAPNPSIPNFEAPTMASQPQSFNFGAPNQSAIFGFGQQQQPQQPPQQPGVYSFGGPPQGTPQVQFNMGTAPNPGGRRLRKAVRRTTPR